MSIRAWWRRRRPSEADCRTCAMHRRDIAQLRWRLPGSVPDRQVRYALHVLATHPDQTDGAIRALTTRATPTTDRKEQS